MKFLPLILLLIALQPAGSGGAEAKVPLRRPAKESPGKKSGSAPAPAKGPKDALTTPSPAPKVEWKPEYYKTRAYVPVEQVAAYYDMSKPAESGKAIHLQNKLFRIEMTRGERRIRLNGWTFYLSFSVVERNGRPLVSVFDVRNVLDPIMRPNDRRDPALLKTVVLDPSGGGRETGIKSPFIQEKELTLDVARRLAEKLQGAGFKVVLTRDSDRLVTAQERSRTAAAVTEEAVFVSLRAGSSDGNVRGFETCTLPPAGTPATGEADSGEMNPDLFAGNINDRESLALATVLQSSAVTSLKALDLGIKRFRFGELRDTNLPAAVCRLGYLSHREEAQKLASPEYRALMAQGLFEGIQRYAKFLSDRMEERLAEDAKRPLRLGQIMASCSMEGEGAAVEQVVLDVPITAAETVSVDRSKVEVQLFLFETGKGGEIDMTTANMPEVEWVSVLPDWKTSRTELLRATYRRTPPLPAELKTHGKRTYYGYVARLIYDGRVMDEAAFPQNLNRCLFYFTNVFPRR